MSAILPGNRQGLPRAVPTEPANNPQRRTNAELDAAILSLLGEAQPLMRGEIRERLHEPDAHVYRRLMSLRDAGKIKAADARHRRRWMLRHYEAPPAPPFNPSLKSITPKPTPPTPTSWWLNLDRASFQDRAKAEQPRMAESKFGPRGTVEPARERNEV